MKRNLGFTLVELMVALVIGLLVVAGAIQLFVMTKRTFNEMEGLSTRQESLRYVSDVVSADIRTASSVSLLSDPALLPVNCNPGDDSAGGSEVLEMRYDQGADDRYSRVNDPYCATPDMPLRRVRYFLNEVDDDGRGVVRGCYTCGESEEEKSPVMTLLTGVNIGAGVIVNGVYQVFIRLDGESDEFSFMSVRREKVVCELSPDIDC
ncbi:prepilin-type N-terminal cleavage/methylation domain-containing protein [Halomonas sp. JS92-SW72]|uniref:PilW family protein n=1 Tax=Halomonas sp. JS92-SW72 TaxID=2306583 RepID=UPI0013C358C5|nr:prepilin-type N-terminal cleavage/methylation domain-containing protein [Halomonas sp. JS92-SW72]